MDVIAHSALFNAKMGSKICRRDAPLTQKMSYKLDVIHPVTHLLQLSSCYSHRTPLSRLCDAASRGNNPVQNNWWKHFHYHHSWQIAWNR